MRHTVNLGRRLAALAVLVCSPSLYAADARFPLTGGGELVLPIPGGWKQGFERDRVPTISFTQTAGPAFHVMVSPLIGPDGRVGSMTAERLRKLVEDGAKQAKIQAVEKSIPLQSLHEGQVEGAYFAATDKAPKSGEYKYLTQGALSVRGLPVTFTILTNDDSRSAESEALRMLRSARRE